MLQDSINLLRGQFLGLNRILSTLSELVSDSVTLESEAEVVGFGIKLLIDNHNFQYATGYLFDEANLNLVCARSTLSLIRGEVDESNAEWVPTCALIANQHNQGQDDQLVTREIVDSLYYSIVLKHQNQKLGYIVVSAPSFDDNHKRFLPMFAGMLSSLIMNIRQQVRLRKDVERRSVELESAWDEAIRSNEAKTRFLSNVSHEYLTPLNVISNAATVLNDTNLSEEQAEAVNTIVNAAHKLSGMVGGTLDFVQNDSGRLVSEKSTVSIPEVLNQVLRFCQQQNQTSGVEITSAIHGSIPFVDVESAELNQILIHLVSNAIKFTHVGRVELSATLERLEGRLATVTFAITDTGIGISEDDQEAIFHAFHQINTSATRLYEGTGLGLALCQKIAKSLESEIKVESRLNEGAVFYFTLPLTVADQVNLDLKNQGAPSPSSSPTDVSVLLVEDNIINQKLAAKLLEKMGCHVDIANDGVDAVNKFTESTYDMVFMDCQMPNMDGFEATTKIRELESDRRTPIIALTANSLPEDRARSFQVGMDEFLTKPIAKNKLREAVARWSSS